MNLIQQVAGRFDVLTKYIDLACKGGLVLFAGSILFLLILQVLMRYIVQIPLPWVEELSSYALGFLVLWGAASYVRSWQHVRVNSLFEMFPQQIRLGISIALNLLLIYFAYLLTTAGYQLAMLGARELSPSGSFTMFWPRQAMTTGGLLIMVQAINNVLRCVSGRPGALA